MDILTKLEIYINEGKNSMDYEMKKEWKKKLLELFGADSFKRIWFDGMSDLDIIVDHKDKTLIKNIKTELRKDKRVLKIFEKDEDDGHHIIVTFPY